MPITSSSAMTTITARNGGAGKFQCFHIDIPDRANGTYFGGARRGRNRSGELIPERGGPKEAKNIPGVLQSYVTYDTLVGMGILLTA